MRRTTVTWNWVDVWVCERMNENIRRAVIWTETKLQPLLKHRKHSVAMLKVAIKYSCHLWHLFTQRKTPDQCEQAKEALMK